MKNEYKITKELMKSWAKGFHFNRARNVIVFIAACYLFIVEMIWCIEMYYLFGYEAVYMPEFLIYGFISLFALYIIFIYPIVSYKRSYKIYSQLYDVFEWMRITEFTNEEIIVTDHTSVYKYHYKNIKGIKERKNEVIINMNHGFGIRIYKDAFVEGTWEECKKMILEKKRQKRG
jgi:hypothetical protein